MVNFSQEDGEKVLGQETPDFATMQGEQEGSDIEFDELVDIDAIQKQLKEHMVEFSDVPEDETRGVIDNSTAIIPSIEDELEKNMAETFAGVKKAPVAIDPNAKKYVVYIDPDNIDFMENL